MSKQDVVVRNLVSQEERTELRHCLKLGIRRTGTCPMSSSTRRCANSKIEELEPLPGELVKH